MSKDTCKNSIQEIEEKCYREFAIYILKQYYKELGIEITEYDTDYDANYDFDYDSERDFDYDFERFIKETINEYKKGK